MPELVQNVLTDIGEQLKTTFADPMVKRGMSIIAGKSGEVRADNALRAKVANKVVGESPVIEQILAYFDIDAVDGLKLLNDPLLAPIIQGFLSKKGGILANPGQGGGLP